MSVMAEGYFMSGSYGLNRIAWPGRLWSCYGMPEHLFHMKKLQNLSKACGENGKFTSVWLNWRTLAWLE